MKKKKAVYCVKLFALIIIIGYISSCDFVGHILNRQTNNEKEAILRLKLFIRDQIYSMKTKGVFVSPKNIDIQRFVATERNAYVFETEGDETTFQVSALPRIYGTTGRISYYVDNKHESIFGADHQGGKATINDPVLESLSDEWKELHK
jgi:hypothetical protein